jgi:hypothetical protein
MSVKSFATVSALVMASFDLDGPRRGLKPHNGLSTETVPTIRVADPSVYVDSVTRVVDVDLKYSAPWFAAC